MKYNMLLLLALLCATFMGCQTKYDSGWSIDQVKDDPIPQPVQISESAPLYWTVYEFCYEAEHAGTDRNMPLSVWENNMNFVRDSLLPHGYTMICTDGFQSMYNNPSYNEQGYMTHYGNFSLLELVKMCKERGLELGVYDNPLWIHGDDNIIIEGTNIRLGNLKYDPERDQVLHPEEESAQYEWFKWLVPSHAGAEEYIDGFFKYYSSIGVKFIRMDFMCVFENGEGHGTARPARGYGSEEYRLGLKYIAQSAAKYGVFTSIVMPHCFEHAAYEARYMNMMRVSADVFCGRWSAFSGLINEYIEYHDESTYYRHRGDVGSSWPQCNNVFDGMIHFSDLSGRGKIKLDGDFTRLNTLKSDDECRSVISLQLLAGGPIAAADQYNSTNISHLCQFYTNDEMLALNKDGFVGKPLSNDMKSTDSQIWYGQMSDGSWIVGLFNREDEAQTRSFGFQTIGESSMMVRDLWSHKDEGEASAISVNLPAHACKVVKLTKN